MSANGQSYSGMSPMMQVTTDRFALAFERACEGKDGKHLDTLIAFAIETMDLPKGFQVKAFFACSVCGEYDEGWRNIWVHWEFLHAARDALGARNYNGPWWTSEYMRELE